MSKEPDDQSGGMFSTAVFAALLLAGVFAGREVCAYVLPLTEGAAMFGMLMLPLGAIVGVSIGLGSLPPESLLSLFSVLGGRHQLDEIVSRSGSKGSPGSLAGSMAIGTGATCAGFGMLISFALKPEVPTLEIVAKLGAAGLVYGAVVGAVVAFVLIGE